MLAESFITIAALLSVRAPEYQDPTSALAAVHRLPVAKYVVGAPVAPQRIHPENVGIDVTARAAVVLDVASGEVLVQKNEETAYPIASLTKLMTAMTFLDTKPNLADQVTILAQDDPREGRVVFPAGETFTKKEILDSLLIGSVNTAGNVIARTTTEGGTEDFVRRMNAKAKELRLQRAIFFEPTGLNAENKATARDVALMLQAAMTYPEIREATEKTSVTLPGRVRGKPYEISSTNLLLGSFLNKKPYHIVAAKTGSLPQAGYCLAQVTQYEGHEVIAVVLGSDNHFTRFQDAKSLTYWTFQNYAWPASFKAAMLPR